MYNVYILQSLLDGSYYIGYSHDPQSRLLKHNSSNTGYTSKKKPWKLVYVQEYETKAEAISREKEIKRQKSKFYITNLIEGSVG